MSMMESVFKKLNCEEGFQIPVANAENKALEEELARLLLHKAKAKTNYDTNKERLEALKSHNRFVMQENEQNQKLLTAHTQRLDNDAHLLGLSKSEKGRIDLERKEIAKRLLDLNEQKNLKKDSLQKSMVKVEKLKAETKWDAEALVAWEEALKKRDYDNELIKKFSQEDVIQFNQFEAKRKLLQNDLNSKKQTAAKILCECNNYEMIIDRTGKVIKQQIIERDALVSQWKDTVKILQQRDQDIEKLQNLIIDNHELIKSRQEAMEEETVFFENEQRNNRHLELEMQELNVVNSRLRKDLVELTQYINLLTSQLNVLKRTLATTSNKLENERMKQKKIRKEIDKKENACVDVKLKVEKLKEKVEMFQEKSMSAAERATHLELLLKKEQKQETDFLVECQRMQQVVYRVDLQIQEQKESGKLAIVQISSCTNSITQMKKLLKQAHTQRDKLRENIYDLDYQIDCLEQKLLKAQEGDLGESEEKAKLIEDLEKSLADNTDVRNLLQDQLTRIQEELQRLNNAIVVERETADVLNKKCENGILVFQIGLKQLAAAKQSKQETQVEENLVNLRVTNIEKDLKKETTSIFSLKKLELNLEQAIRERHLEINAAKTILQAKRRHLTEDKGRLKADIVVRQLRIEQFQKKYQIELMFLGKDEDGQPFSITHFKVRNAQEKYMLQEEGDKLDKKIKTAEKEIVAMENTLKVVNMTNGAFKVSLGPIQDTDKEIEEMADLETKLKEASVLVIERRKEFNAKKQEVDEVEKELTELRVSYDEVENKLKQVEEEFEAIQKQERDKSEKLQRVKRLLQHVSKKLAKKNIIGYNRDFEIRQLKESNKSALQRLVTMALDYPEVSPLIHRYAKEYNIELPKKKWPPSSSSRSSLSSLPSTPISSASHGSESSTSIKKVELSLNI